jgi:Peptidase family M23
MKPVTAVLALLLVCPGAVVYARSGPWPARKPAREPTPAHQLLDVATWPPEPATPATIDEARFRSAFAHLCHVEESDPIADLAPLVLSKARASALDPFLFSGLVFYASACKTKRDGRMGVGLLGIDPALYRSPGAPPLPVDKSDLTKARLHDPATNLSVGARLLEMWEERHAEIDEKFGSVPHRNEVSHFIWGDRVASSGQEDLVLTARRRMLASYSATKDALRATTLGLNIVSPLEAPPRVASSGIGDDRDGGARQHRGLDISAALGEPVRAVADGVVIFAGANIPGHPHTGAIPPDKIRRYTNRTLGTGGIYLCIEHDPERHVRTCYMHLSAYIVGETDHVTCGQTIGFVGRTGVKVSPPHLHFEVRVDDRFMNPVRTLGDLVIPPKATMTYQYKMKAKRARRLHVEAGHPRSAQPAA